MVTFLVLKRSLHTSVLRGRGAVAHPGWYPRDHMPGNYPKTDEERRAAAIKYGLRPEDYTPYDPDDIINHVGDYPDPGLFTPSHRDPHDIYSDRHNRRNWNEPLMKQAIRYRVDRCSFDGLDEEHFLPLQTLSRFATLLVPMVVFSLVFYYNAETLRKVRDYYGFRWYVPKLPKQYPYDFLRAFPMQDPRDYPILNYSFEPAEGGQNNVEEDNARFPFNENDR
ncbi:hypothetical protein ACQ4LE_006798 [Meloidogyne hapla]|uniref:NADH dehydrogenase [ubiquinone] 1 beta subcomplex subunit 8, mitochondrial n=1 Tax=Meloidogyne hapla TaxID=6305 RepID=A0A1I8BTA2_MELHA